MNRLTPEQQALAADPKHLAMARALAGRVAARFAGGADWREQFEAAALFGLVEAAAKFDPERGLKFTTYAQYRIRHAIEDYCRETRPKGYRRLGWLAARGEELVKVVSLSTTVHTSDRGPMPLADLVDNGEEPTCTGADYADFVETVTRGLSPAQRDAVRLHYLHGWTQTRIAGRFGLSESRVSLLLGEAHALIRERLEAHDPEPVPHHPKPETPRVKHLHRARNPRPARRAATAV